MDQSSIVTIENTAVSKDLFRRLCKLAKAKGVNVGEDIAPNNLETVKSPLEKRIKASKFNALLETMTDEQVMATAVALLFDTKVQDAVRMYHTSVANYTQVAAIAYHLEKRNIDIAES